jgi:uncharacterized protein YdaU (DUF1376 family)
MNYYQHNIGDFAILTQGLDLESVGIVIRVIDRMMSTEKPIKTQWVSLAFPKETQEKAICILESLFEETEEGWVHPILMGQIEQYQRNAQKNRENGKKGGRPRKSETQPKPSGFSEETQTEAKETLTINQEPVNHKPTIEDTRTESAPRVKEQLVKPEGVSEQTWTDWQALKQKLCKSCTQRMVNAIVREAAKAGMTVEEAMIYQLEKGWKGFEADWITDKRPNKRSTNIRFEGHDNDFSCIYG